MYLFFSSDIFPLYKKDILATISLPEDYSIHFRYPKSLIPKNIQDSLNTLIEKEGIIVYVRGNDANYEKKSRPISFLPIRNVRVKNAYWEKNTNLVHVFLKLGKFIKTSDIPRQQFENADLTLPPHLFIHELSKCSTSLVEWHEKITELVAFDPCFKDHLFFNVDVKCAELGYRDQAEIKFDQLANTSYFELTEDKNYLLDLAIYNTAAKAAQFEDYFLKLSYPTENFTITNPESIVVGANADNRKYIIKTKDTLSVMSTAYLKILSYKKTGTTEAAIYDELVRLNIVKSNRKTRSFVFFSVLGVFGASLLAFTSSQIGAGKVTSENGFLLLLTALFLVITSASGLFYYFNKK